MGKTIRGASLQCARWTVPFLLLVFALAACPESDDASLLNGLTIGQHSARFFPIDEGPHAVDCAQCHTRPQNFEFSCVGCHAHEPVATDLLHETTDEYAYESPACYTCHSRGVQRPIFDHVPGRTACATCHDEGRAFAALPVEDFTHPERGARDCSACHLSVIDWADVQGGPAELRSDPLADIEVTALFPRWAGTSIVSVSPALLTLSMPMDHDTPEIEADVMRQCAACHSEPATMYPGKLHSSLATLRAPQPTACAGCHASSAPAGFVGPLATDPPRDPATGAMRHDAVIWLSDAPTTSGLVPAECALCHQTPSQGLAATWASGNPAPELHAPLELAGLPQPESCLDCHANARPAVVYDATNAALPDGVVFDHAAPLAQTDCARCHSESTEDWASGRFHSVEAPLLSTCLPCHDGQRPTTTSDWQSPDFRDRPFDYVTNSAGIAHGAGQDCVLCHSADAGALGADPTWQGGEFAHDTGTIADTTCVACHSTQRPDLVIGNAAALLGFDHILNGAGDCVGCHQASREAGTFATYFNPATGTLPGGDWRGGVTYPGDFPIGSLTQFVTLTEITLLRSGPNNLVTGTTSITGILYNQMRHTSSVLPPALNPGSPTDPDGTTCWHCHTNIDGNVTSLVDGQYHAALAAFSATPGGVVAPLPQPTGSCKDCHVVPPRNIVQGPGVFLQPMDHGVLFTAPVTLDGQSVAGVAAMDCSSCHAQPGDRWDDGVFHANIGAAVPQDCTLCHYPLVAQTALSDLSSGTDFDMRHASTHITVQNCQLCHEGALAAATQLPLSSTSWSGGVLHEILTPQPTACVECHSRAEPADKTQSLVTWTFAQGGTATNAAQWMSHTTSFVVARDCAQCHTTDADASAWQRSTRFHAAVSQNVTTCAGCHGGGAAGTTNNMPSGLIDSDLVSSAAGDAATGVAAGTLAQITHADRNVTTHDCNFCHRQVGPATAPALLGEEWRQAEFHVSFTGANPLSLDGNTGRCSNCHLNVKPGPSFPFDHSAFTAQPGTQDCTSCHSWPGTGTAQAPNWLGADGGAPPFITVGGFVIPQPPADDATTIERNIANLPHPTVADGESCSTCHGPGGNRNAIGYDHASTLITGRCTACHEAGTDLIGAVWNGATTLADGAGDSRPFTISVMQVSAFGDTRGVDSPNHFFPTDCNECHQAPSGVVATSTGATYAARWSFGHDEPRMTNPATCIQCHGEDGLLPQEPIADPLQSLTVNTKLPTYAGTSMVSVTDVLQTLDMSMDHLTTEVPASVMLTCTTCHQQAGVYYPGALHTGLASIGEPQPTRCTDCHLGTMPTGFVGPLDPARNPLTGPMKHDAVAWINDAPTTSRLVPVECGVCHTAPTPQLASTWAGGASPTQFHDALSAAGIANPSSCIDCHANSRSEDVHTSAPLPPGVLFDHGGPYAQTDCASCHGSATFADWSDGRFHRVGDTTPSTCLPCHDGQRPVSTAGWLTPPSTRAPFDFVTNALGIGHGANQDCVLCHSSAGTGSWGVSQNWQGGAFGHAPSSIAGETCIACHTTQRADLVVANSAALLGFNHATAGTGDCFGCHQATVAAGTYQNLFTAQGTFPGDWRGGVSYPGDVLVSSGNASITLTELLLVRSGPYNLVTSTSSIQATFNNQMLHTAQALPQALNGGPASNPDATTCWHCHTNVAGAVTSFLNGAYHASLDSFRNTPGGAVTPLPQPTTGCLDCHAQMHPGHIVQKNGSYLQPMDHDALFTGNVTIGGQSVGGVAAIDCGVCHSDPGGSWSDGVFHANIGAAVPQDCTVCHYPTVANSAVSDVVSGTSFSMRHASPQITFQNCRTCHTTALARATQAPLTPALWSGGTLHPRVSPQPASCLECHDRSAPPGMTQGSTVYALPQGGTLENGAQWMSHANVLVTGRECAQCHATDARATASAWSPASLFHGNASNVTSCSLCHGPDNGLGTVPGFGNNLPAGLTDSSTVSSAAGAAGTGIAAGTRDRITHLDANVASYDCNFCHTQAGGSTLPGIAGREWAQADFHTSFGGANPLVVDDMTGRCSNCHLNLKPGAGFAFDHSSFTNEPGTTDCAACHSWPGTGTPSQPNWLDAVGGFPPVITVGGFLVPQPPAANTTTIVPNIPGLPHPGVAVGTACSSCHTQPDNRGATGYDHASTLIDGRCVSCHEAGTDLVSDVWNGATTAATGAGDSRPFTIDTLSVSAFGQTRAIATAGHFYPTDCFECHGTPSGVARATTGAAYAAAWSFPHEELRMTDPGTCIQCHGETGLLPADLVADPLQSLTVTAKIPSYAGTTMVSATDVVEVLEMPMDHLTTEVSVSSIACRDCHADTQSFYPGVFHSALNFLDIAPPTNCAGCHFTTMPAGFVGPLDPPRDPVTGAMKHNAVVWVNDAPTTSGLVPLECKSCHDAPSRTLAATWAVGATPAAFHDALAAASLPNPSSCIDCHANSRSDATLSGAPMPAGVVFDHRIPDAQTDCIACHRSGDYNDWADGTFHQVGDTAPATCLPCHAGRRPTTTAGWLTPPSTRAPFDFVTNASGITHGAGQDCVLCHDGPGTGAFGVNQNWAGGFYAHDPGTIADQTCIACHSTQRADLLVANSAALLGFDHAQDGTGDCIGCHQASVSAGSYTDVFNAQSTLPGGDWAGGISYPGDVLVSTDEFISLTELLLTRSGPYNLVTGMSSIQASFYNAMLHTASVLPPALQGGPPGSPNATTCWHCHTNVSGTVTSYANGAYHAALDTFRNTPGGALAPIAQPTSGCLDCHAQMHPGQIVERNASFLRPMDHDAAFTAAVNIGGSSVTNVAQIDCGVCHADAGGLWNDGEFHVNIGAAQPADCTVCHYPLVANTAVSDRTVGSSFSMRHASSEVRIQNCKLCHTAALSRATQTPVATLWNDGTLHPHVSPQPATCLGCHTVSRPTAATQSLIAYTLPQGGTTTNGGQWMTHTNTYVTGRDCVLCHAADARTSGSAWSRSSLFHSRVTGVTTCAQCHGTTNGNGTVAGTRNNLPAGLINSSTTSSSAGAALTGIAAGTRDQIVHTDVNVTSHDCNFCHTQNGPSTVNGIQGREWAQANLHTSFTTANPLLMNTTTGRCSNCHMNLRPGASYPFNHSTFTNVSGSTDCASCHSWPGTGTATAPNWLGAAGGYPAIIATGGFLVPQPPATNATTTVAAIANLPHPTPGANACTACHVQSSGGDQATGYDHASTLINSKCASCHEAGSNLVNPVWNGATTTTAGAGDTRPFTLTPLRVTFSGNSLTVTGGNHFYPVDCYQCHNAPTGLARVTTGAAYIARWDFPHRESRMSDPSTCMLCHGNDIPR